MVLELQGFKTLFCVSWMKSTKKRKMIVEKSSFQKVYFPHDFQISKFMHRPVCEKTVLSFLSKNVISGVRMRTEQIEKLFGVNLRPISAWGKWIISFFWMHANLKLFLLKFWFEICCFLHWFIAFKSAIFVFIRYANFCSFVSNSCAIVFRFL